MIELESFLNERLSIENESSVELHMATTMNDLRKIIRANARNNFVDDSSRAMRRIDELFKAAEVIESLIVNELLINYIG